jgi:nicotinamidase-related amidase
VEASLYNLCVYPMAEVENSESDHERKMKAMRESLIRHRLQQSNPDLKFMDLPLSTAQIVCVVFSALVALGVAIVCIVAFASAKNLTSTSISTLNSQIMSIQSDIANLNAELSSASALAQSLSVIQLVNQSVSNQIQADVAAEVSLNNQLQNVLSQVNTGCGTVSCPAAINPVATSVPAASTALLVLDMVPQICDVIATCNATIAPLAALISTARQLGVPVIYSTVANYPIVDALTNMTAEPVINTYTADKFLNTDLETLLASKNLTNVIITGVASNGAVLYTSYETAARGYAVSVPTDGISAATAYITQYTQFQLINAPGQSNSQNTPNVSGKTSLTSTTLITFT